MGVTKQVLTAGNGVDKPKKGDTITMEYTGWLYDDSKTNNKGKQYVSMDQSSYTVANHNCRFDSSVGRSAFKTPIGVGRVIKGQHNMTEVFGAC